MITYKNLRFRDKQIEHRFNKWYLPIELNIFRYALLLGIITNFLFISLDYFLYEGTTVTQFLILRLGSSIVAIVVYGLTFTWIKTYQQYQVFALIFGLFCFLATYCSTFFENVDSFYFYTVNGILIIFVFTLINIRFYLIRFIAALLVITHLLIIKMNFDIALSDFVHQVYGIISIIIMSLACNWMVEFQKRQNFLDNQVIAEQKGALEENILEKDVLLKKLKEQNQELNVFNHSVSHDLKTPLRNINTFSSLLAAQCNNRFNEEGKVYLNFILDGTSKMNTLINDLLAYSKVKQTELELTDLNMNQLVTTIFKEQTKVLPTQPILSKTLLPNVKADEVLIKQVWNNLISNALKYSSKKKEIQLKIGASKENEGITYFIKDNGVGFDMKYAERLFEPFSRLHNEQDFKGTGVGLSLVHRIVQKHNGRIWAESEPNKGATFYLFMPN